MAIDKGLMHESPGVAGSSHNRSHEKTPKYGICRRSERFIKFVRPAKNLFALFLGEGGSERATILSKGLLNPSV